jgi:hypothetical protein
MKRFEIHYGEADEISNEIGIEFAKGNSDYAAIQKVIEEKHGEGALMLAFRTLITYRNLRKQQDARELDRLTSGA